MQSENGLDVIDLEEFSKSGKHPPKAQAYRIRIDTKQYVVEVESMTARKVLEDVAGKKPAERYKIYQQVKGETNLLELDAIVDFTTPGIERFKTIPLDQTDGLAPAPRRYFLMPEADRLFLEAQHPAYETVADGEAKLVIIAGYPVPPGYNHSSTTLALRIDPKYPTAQIDMVYFNPALARKDGRGIANLSKVDFDKCAWQQWSRHRTEANPWREGFDCVETHLMLVDHWLLAELKR